MPSPAKHGWPSIGSHAPCGRVFPLSRHFGTRAVPGMVKKLWNSCGGWYKLGKTPSSRCNALLGSWLFPWFCWCGFHLLPVPSPRFVPSWQLPEVEGLEWAGCAPCHQTHQVCAGLIPVGEARLVWHCPVLVKNESIWFKTAPFVLCHVTWGVFLHQPLQDEKGRSR